MSSILIRGAAIEQCLFYCNSAGQRTAEISFSSAWTQPVCEAFGWVFEREGDGSGSLDGSLAGISMMCEPNGKDLKPYRFDIPISKVHAFKHKAHVEDGKTKRRELTFIVTTVDDGAMPAVWEWIKSVGPSDSKAQLKITFNAEEQMELPETDSPKNGKTKRATAQESAE